MLSPRKLTTPTGVTHDLKVWVPFFHCLYTGEKNFEVRENDRDFKMGDVLRLREWSRTDERYTGREVSALVTFILHGGPGAFGLKSGYVVMALARIE